MWLTFMNFYELHQESFHCHQDVLMKKTTDAISGIARKESVRVALLQTHGEDGAILLKASLKSERSFIGSLRPDVLREIHQFSFCI